MIAIKVINNKLKYRKMYSRNLPFHLEKKNISKTSYRIEKEMLYFLWFKNRKHHCSKRKELSNTTCANIMNLENKEREEERKLSQSRCITTAQSSRGTQIRGQLQKRRKSSLPFRCYQ